jgi:hypothetical protein
MGEAPQHPVQPREPNRGKTERALERQARELEQQRAVVQRDLESGKKRYTEGK